MWEGLWCQRSWWHCAMSLRVVEQSGFKYELISFYSRTDHVPFDTLWAPLGIKSPVHRTGKKPDWDQTGLEKTRLSVAVWPFHEKENRKKPVKSNRFERFWLGSNWTCVVLVNTLYLQLFWRKMVKNCMWYSQNDMLLSNLTCTTTCSYCFLRCRKLLSL